MSDKFKTGDAVVVRGVVRYVDDEYVGILHRSEKDDIPWSVNARFVEHDNHVDPVDLSILAETHKDAFLERAAIAAMQAFVIADSGDERSPPSYEDAADHAVCYAEALYSRLYPEPK